MHVTLYRKWYFSKMAMSSTVKWLCHPPPRYFSHEELEPKSMSKTHANAIRSNILWFGGQMANQPRKLSVMMCIREDGEGWDGTITPGTLQESSGYPRHRSLCDHSLRCMWGRKESWWIFPPASRGMLEIDWWCLAWLVHTCKFTLSRIFLFQWSKDKNHLDFFSFTFYKW